MNFDFIQDLRVLKTVYPKNKYSNFQFIKYFNSFQDKLPMEFMGEKFLSLDTEFAVVPSYVGEKIDFLIFRSIHDKKFNYVGFSNLFYIYGLNSSFNNFKYGKPLVIVEGSLDCETVKLLYPYCVAILSSVISENQLAYLTGITNKFVLLLDADSAGVEGTKKTEFRFKKMNCDVDILENYGGLKDISDLWMLDSFDREFCFSYYEEMFKNIL